MPPPDAPSFYISSFKLLPKDEGRCLFLVQSDVGPPREITVRRDEQDFYEFLVNGDQFYDAEHESPALTQSLMFWADLVMAEYEANLSDEESEALKVMSLMQVRLPRRAS